MDVGDLQQFVGSMGTLFGKTGNPHADMTALGAALDPFKEFSLPAFATFLQAAKEFRDTGKVTVQAGKQKAASGSKKGPKTPVKTKADVVAIQAAVDELERLYSHAADPDLTYTTIETTVKQIHDAFDAGGLKEVAKGFKLTSGLTGKGACREKIEHKIKERKARNEKGEVIAAAAKAASSTEDDDIVGATVIDDK